MVHNRFSLFFLSLTPLASLPASNLPPFVTVHYQPPESSTDAGAHSPLLDSFIAAAHHSTQNSRMSSKRLFILIFLTYSSKLLGTTASCLSNSSNTFCFKAHAKFDPSYVEKGQFQFQILIFVCQFSHLPLLGKPDNTL